MKKIKIFFFTVVFVFCIQYLQAQKQNDNDKTVEKNAALNIVDTAKAQLGIKYKYAGRSPEVGFDCSGFVHYVYKQNGYDMPVISGNYVNIGTEIDRNECQPGDIILFAGRDVKTKPVGHVGIVTQKTDDEILFIHSASSANRGIVISRLSIGYYKKRFAGIRRVQYDID